MAKGSKRHTRKMNTQKGGNAPESGWGYVLNTVGDGWTQFMDTFSAQPGEVSGALGSNQLVPKSNPNANVVGAPVPNVKGQAGGRRRGNRKSKKGGFLGVGAVLEQAVVPFGLLAIQNSYGKSRRAKGNGHKRSRRMH